MGIFYLPRNIIVILLGVSSARGAYRPVRLWWVACHEDPFDRCVPIPEQVLRRIGILARCRALISPLQSAVHTATLDSSLEGGGASLDNRLICRSVSSVIDRVDDTVACPIHLLADRISGLGGVRGLVRRLHVDGVLLGRGTTPDQPRKGHRNHCGEEV